MTNDVLKHKYTKIGLLASLYAFGPLLFSLTDPNVLPLPLLMLPFVWLFAVLFASALMVLKYKTSASKKQARIIASLLASLLVLLAVFQSIHQLSVRDVAISFAIIGIAALYLLRADFIK